MLMKTMILPQKVATGTAYACLRPIERASSSGARACSQKVLGLRMFPYAFLLREDNGFHQYMFLDLVIWI